MDKTDVILSQLLLANSRLSYRELADKLGLSINAVHKRIQHMQESGIIRAFTAKVSLITLEALVVWIFGRSEANSTKVHEQLGKHDSIYWVAVAGGNNVYVGAYLRNISELDPLLEYLKKEAKIPYPTVGILSSELFGPKVKGRRETALSALDYQIIYALRHDSRRAISEIAEELMVSYKTLRHRLSRLIDRNLIELSIEWYPDASNDIIAIFHLHLKPSAKREDVGPYLLNKYTPQALFLAYFSNLPNQMICIVWSSSMKDLKEVLDKFDGEGFFESIEPNILYSGYIFETWRDKLVVEKGATMSKRINRKTVL